MNNYGILNDNRLIGIQMANTGIYSPYQNGLLDLLTRNSSWAIWGDKATGTKKGVNSPATNPIQDLVGTADGTLQGFAFTTASGYVDVPVKGVGDEISYSNLVVNGDFANGTTGWTTGGGATYSSANKILSITGNGTLSAPYSKTSSIVLKSLNGNKLYVKGKARVTNSNCSILSIRATYGTTNAITIFSGIKEISNPILNQWYEFSAIFTLNSADTGFSTDVILVAQHQYPDAATANGKVMGVQEVQAINLTDNPQVKALESKLGRQLTATECDYLFDFTATTNAIKAKVVTGIQGDGANDVILLPSNAPNMIGLQDFGYSVIFKTSTLKTQFINFRGLDGDNLAEIQFAIKPLVDGSLVVILGGNSYTVYSAGEMLANTFYKLIITRISGVLQIDMNDATEYNAANVVNVTTQPNARIFARTTDAAGTLHTDFSNSILLQESYAGDNVARWKTDQLKEIKSVYGL